MENRGEIVIYQADSGKPQIEVKLAGDTLWLSQRLMADVFDKDSDTVGLHIKNIFSEGELLENETTDVFSVVQQEGNRKAEYKA